jgi:hypothetical protein
VFKRYENGTTAFASINMRVKLVGHVFYLTTGVHRLDDSLRQWQSEDGRFCIFQANHAGDVKTRGSDWAAVMNSRHLRNEGDAEVS